MHNDHCFQTSNYLYIVEGCFDPDMRQHNLLTCRCTRKSEGYFLFLVKTSGTWYIDDWENSIFAI